MSTVSNSTAVFQTVEVFDPDGHRSVLLEGLKPSSTVAEIQARAMSGLKLSGVHPWNLRDESTGRLLLEQQRLADISSETHVTFAMQPDAGLG